MNPKNPHAKALGKLAKGKPKNYSPEELAKRTARLPRRTKEASPIRPNLDKT